MRSDYLEIDLPRHADGRLLQVEVWHDECPSKPWKDDDGFPPMWSPQDYRNVELGESKPLSFWRAWQAIPKHLKARAWFKFATEHGLEVLAPHGMVKRGEHVRINDARLEAIEDAFDGSNSADRIDMLETLWNCVPGVVTGRASVSHRVNAILCVATPGWQKSVGWGPLPSGRSAKAKATRLEVTQRRAADMENCARTVAQWCEGEVYGFTIWATPVDAEGEPVGEPEALGTCGSFYGDDDEKSGLTEMARDMAKGYAE